MWNFAGLGMRMAIDLGLHKVKFSFAIAVRQELLNIDLFRPLYNISRRAKMSTATSAMETPSSGHYTSWYAHRFVTSSQMN